MAGHNAVRAAAVLACLALAHARLGYGPLHEEAGGGFAPGAGVGLAEWRPPAHGRRLTLTLSTICAVAIEYTGIGE